MQILLLYESCFGNTKQIAGAIREGIEGWATVTMIEAGANQSVDLNNVDLLVAGSPTQKFSATPGIKEAINSLERRMLRNLPAATFDTRIALESIDSRFLRFMVNKGGYAARTIAKKLKRKGMNLISDPAGFLVTGEKGPLKEGELERAARWGAELELSLKESLS